MSARRESLALRKRVLVMRAAVERAELSERVDQLRNSTRLPRLLGASLGGVGIPGALTTAFTTFRRYPILGTVLSLLVRQLGSRLASRGPRRSLLRSALFGALKLGGLAAAGWQAWRWWQRQQPPRNAEYR